MTESPSESKKERIDRIFRMQQSRHLEIGARPLKERKKDLKRLLSVLLAHRSEIADALFKDLGKPAFESDMTELYHIKSDIKHALKSLNDWAAKKRVKTPLSLLGTRAWVKREPKGVVLIISPWNFPFNLTFCPLVSALAAGNCAILKPSEATPHSAALINKIIAQTFSPDHVAVVEGEAAESIHLTGLPFHHIFFTGGPEIGKKVMAAAARNLTSVTLELGGKSPAVIDKTAQINEAAKRIVWSRFCNSGQICISPDYALVDASIYPQFVKALKSTITVYYGDAMNSNALSNLVSQGHFQKVKAFLDDALSKGAKIAIGGKSDEERNFIEPTVLTDVTPEMLVMQEEIFGPLLPVRTFRNIDDALEQINRLERPLAFYIFSSSRTNIRHLVRDSRAGSTGINETLIQFIHPELPFGGVNFSGIGKAHGEFGFTAFSNERSFIRQVFRFNAPRFSHPPYNKFSKWLSDILIRWF